MWISSRFFTISASISLLTLLCVSSLPAQAESLYRASTSYQGQGPLVSRSLFTPPISRQVGDIVTININDVSTQANAAELKITRNQTINENGSNMFNNTIGFLLNKLPFGTGKLKDTLSAPSFNNLNNANNLGSKAEITHTSTFQTSVACQVTQVLPNGDLIVQGQKIMMSDKERQNVMVTGIVRPFYLDRSNQIASNMVGNFQMVQSGKGVISRQQDDGLANKVYQFFN